MKFESAPLSVGATSVEHHGLLIAAIAVVIVIAFLLSARREVALFALCAGLIGVAMSV